MMFNTVIDRRGSSCLKWDWDERLTGYKELLPFWIADMDFKAAPPILEALQKRLEHGVFGYSACPESLIEAMQAWFDRRHGWKIHKDSLLEIPGTVPFIHLFIQNFTKPGDSVLIQEPVYYPFRLAVKRNGRQVLSNSLKEDSTGKWVMDLANLQELITKHRPSLLIFCSPHNPVSRVWSLQELKDLAAICREGGVTVLSDEIHADLVQPGWTHIPWLSLTEAELPRSLCVISATKSFNLPGLTTAWAVVNDAEFRRETASALDSLGWGTGYSAPLSYTATEAAWTDGAKWLEGLLAHIGKNDQLTREFFAMKIPELKAAVLEATYLAWIDASSLEISDDELYERLLKNSLWLSRGSQFGSNGRGFLRMNLACPQSQLEKGLELMVKALKR